MRRIISYQNNRQQSEDPENLKTKFTSKYKEHSTMLPTSTSYALGGKVATMLAASAARCVFEHMDRKSAISPKRGELLGAGRILPPGSVEGYPSSREPPHEYARRILRKTNVDDSSCHTKCTQGLRRRRRPASEERGEPPILPSPRMARDAAGSRNLRSGQAKEPPTRKRRRIGDRAD